MIKRHPSFWYQNVISKWYQNDSQIDDQIDVKMHGKMIHIRWFYDNILNEPELGHWAKQAHYSLDAAVLNSMSN